MQAGEPDSEDPALACLSLLAAASGVLHRQVSQFTESVGRAEWTRGLSYGQMLPLRKRLEMVGQISDALRDLTRYGHQFRRLEARALYAQGLTMAELASVFGVSRQRVSVLLHDEEPGPSGDGGEDGLTG
jgi:hypothetical protein